MTIPGAGSQGTETNALQLLKDSTVIIKNGTMHISSGLKMGIQNYSNLTLDNVKIYGDDSVKYTLSNNYGTIILKNHTELHPTSNNVAFDVYYGLLPAYDEPGVFVTIEDNSVVVDGKVEFGKANRISDPAELATHASLTIPEAMDLVFKAKPDNYEWQPNGDGYKSLRPTE